MINYFSRPLPHLALLLICVMCCAFAVMLPVLSYEADGNTYWLLSAQSLGVFLLPAYIAMRLIRRRALTRLGLRHPPKIGSTLCVMVLMLMILPFVSLTAGLNAALPLPDWIIQMEKEAEQFTERLLMTESWQDFWLNVLCIAALPALAEEVFFRGFLQNALHRLYRNAHLAIFVTAVVFSAFHLQFLSFLPRLFLGIALGYLFHWSSSLWLSVAAHFMNNVLGVCAYFYYAANNISVDFDIVGDIFRANTLFVGICTFLALLLLGVIYYIEHKKKIDAAVKKMEKEGTF